MGQETFYNAIERTENLVEELKSYLETDGTSQDITYNNDQLAGLNSIIDKYLKSSYVSGTDGKLIGGKSVLKLRFPAENGFEWINTDGTDKPNLETESANNVIVVDFFTHCCINCIHAIEELRQIHHSLESDFKSGQLEDQKCGLKLLSVHSPKFATEKQKSSIKSSVDRMGLHHSQVLNDPNNVIWNELGIFCWPTIMIMGPNPNIKNAGPNLLFVFVGEGKQRLIELLCRRALGYFAANLQPEDVEAFLSSRSNDVVDNQASIIQCKAAKATPDASYLHFPGKISLFQDLVCISDTAHHRLIVAQTDGTVKAIIGGTGKGLSDGTLTTARFYNPQGTCFLDANTLVVADTGNHAVRKIDLAAEEVTTLIQPNASTDMADGKLMSPWDVCQYGPNGIAIAAAGNHQILIYFFEDDTVFAKPVESRILKVLAGSGKEENRNNSYPLKASFAQPSGIVALAGTLFLADSESSSIRCIDEKGKVSGVVGATRDPTDLFAYGDQDGTGYDAKLQHPIGVTYSAGRLYIADTYNHKVKAVDLSTSKCETFIGDGTSGNAIGSYGSSRFSEPAGLDISPDGRFLFVADTNNHSIKVADLDNCRVMLFHLYNAAGSPITDTPSSKTYDQTFALKVSPYQEFFTLQISISDVPTSFEGGIWQVTSPVHGPSYLKGVIPSETSVSPILTIEVIKVIHVPWLRELECSVTIAYCLASDQTCRRKIVKLLVQLEHDVDSPVSDDPPALSLNFRPGAEYFSK